MLLVQQRFLNNQTQQQLPVEDKALQGWGADVVTIAASGQNLA